MKYSPFHYRRIDPGYIEQLDRKICWSNPFCYIAVFQVVDSGKCGYFTKDKKYELSIEEGQKFEIKLPHHVTFNFGVKLWAQALFPWAIEQDIFKAKKVRNKINIRGKNV